jgi:hypothetical protein
VLDEIRTHAVALKRPIDNLELLEFYAATAPQESARSATAIVGLESR